MKFLSLVFAAFLGLSSALRAEVVINGSFEADGNQLSYSNVTGWSGSLSGFGGDVWDLNYASHGTRGARIFMTTVGNYSAGDFGSVSQSVDLTTVQSVQFDAFPGFNGQSYSGLAEAQFWVGGTKQWSATSIGEQQNISVDVSAITGNQTIEFRLAALTDFSSSGTSRWFDFDNVRTTAVPEPSSGLLLLASSLPLAYIRRRRS